jgi:hypothetical protein
VWLQFDLVLGQLVFGILLEEEGLVFLVGVSSKSLLKWRAPEAEGVLAKAL